MHPIFLCIGKSAPGDKIFLNMKVTRLWLLVRKKKVLKRKLKYVIKLCTFQPVAPCCETGSSSRWRISNRCSLWSRWREMMAPYWYSWCPVRIPVMGPKYRTFYDCLIRSSVTTDHWGSRLVCIYKLILRWDEAPVWFRLKSEKALPLCRITWRGGYNIYLFI